MSLPRPLLVSLTLGLALALGAAPAGATAPSGPPAGDAVTSAPAAPPPPFTWNLTDSGDDSGYRGLDAVSSDVAWASSDSGDVLRTIDHGAHWKSVGPADASTLLIRDVEAVDANTALILTVGSGDNSRVYKTVNGGKTWKETFRNKNKDAFYDCMAMSGPLHGLAMSDPVNGKFRIIQTDDGGDTWKIADSSGMPDALEGEAGFAASGTCLVARRDGNAWFATGGGEVARVFRTVDGGDHWTVAATPVRSTEAGGIFSLAFRTNNKGIAIGGDFTAPGEAIDALARTNDGGATWKLVPEKKAPGGYRSGSAWFANPPPTQQVVFAVGPTGSDVSVNGGRTWKSFDDGAFNSVDCAPDGACWAAGPAGRLAFLSVG